MIPYGKHDISRADIDAVVEVLNSDFLTQGPVVPEFEKAVAARVGAGHAVAANSATSALHLACRALGIGEGDTVWTSPITFVASANCARYCGADLDFVDIDPATYNLSPIALEAKLAEADKTGSLPKAVIPVHMCGQSCDMAVIHALSRKYGFSIIEDASHAIGGYYQGKPIGDCRFSDIAVFSFHPVKIITTAEGGMAVTNNPDLAQRMDLLRSHGITRNPELFANVRNSTADTGSRTTDPGPSAWYYEQLDLGYNYRMTELQAALGLSQLKRLDEFVSRRQEIAKCYDRLLAGLPLITPWQHPDSYSAWHLYIIRLNLKELPRNRRQIFDYLREEGIGVNVHYIPVHTQPYYQARGVKAGQFPEAEKYYQQALTLPLFPAMRREEQEKVILKLQEAVQR